MYLHGYTQICDRRAKRVKYPIFLWRTSQKCPYLFRVKTFPHLLLITTAHPLQFEIIWFEGDPGPPVDFYQEFFWGKTCKLYALHIDIHLFCVVPWQRGELPIVIDPGQSAPSEDEGQLLREVVNLKNEVWEEVASRVGKCQMIYKPQKYVPQSPNWLT